MKRPAIKRIGLIGNSEKVSARALVNEAARLITRAGRRVYCDSATAKLAGFKFKTGVVSNAAALAKEVDLLLVFGGDGTMLRVASETAGSPTPLLGINIGGLGFLTAVSSSELLVALRHVWNGEFTIEDRALIEVSGKSRGEKVHACALNDIVISRGIVSRLIALEVKVNGEPFTRYRCDGLIVSTPTGSTAYALSAGGAVVHPQAEVFELTPICPHTLSNRAVIINLDSKIEVKVVSPKPETILSADGVGICEVATGESVTIVRSRDTVRLMHLTGSSFFDTLRRKLAWSGANV